MDFTMHISQEDVDEIVKTARESNYGLGEGLHEGHGFGARFRASLFW